MSQTCAEKEVGRLTCFAVQKWLWNLTFLLHLSLLMLDIGVLLIPPVHTGQAGPSGSLPLCVPAERPQQQVRGKASPCNAVTGQRVVFTRIVFCRVWPKFALYSEQIFFRSTSQRDTIILVTNFSLAPLDWKESGRSGGGDQQVKFQMLETKAQRLMQRRCKRTLANFLILFLQQNGTFTSGNDF